MLRWLAFLLFIAVPACEGREPTTRKKPSMGEATQIANLISPAKLATFRERGAIFAYNARKAVPR